jgi:hypothetical protein
MQLLTIPQRHRTTKGLGPQHPDPRQHLRAVMLGDQQQYFHRGLPFGGSVLGLRGA